MTDYMQKAREVIRSTRDASPTIILARTIEALDTERAAHDATQLKLAVSEVSLRLTEEAFLIEKKRVEATKAELQAALEEAALWKQSEQAASDQFDKMAARADKAEAELQALREAAQALVNQVGPQNTRVYRSDPVMQTLIAALTRKEA